MESFLGEGAYGKVYKVSNEEDSNEKVYKVSNKEFGHKSYAALKVIPIPYSSSEISQLMSEGLADDSLNSYISAMAEGILSEIRFVQEFQDSANVASCEDYAVIPKEDEPGYNILIRMELLESLENLLPTRSFGEDDAIAVGVDICRALELLDKSGSVHRDVKPENIFISKQGRYKLGDFGIARQIDCATSGMSKRGTLNYMAPEVFKRLEYATSADLYSLGLILYRILNNDRMPFVPANTAPLAQSERNKLFERRMSGETLPPPALASPEMSRVILKACAFDRKDRFKTASEMRMALEACRVSKIVLPPETQPVSAPEPKLVPDSEPKPVPVPEPKPVPVPEPKPVPVPEPKPVPVSESKPVPVSELKPSLEPSPPDRDPKRAKPKEMFLIGMALAILIIFAIIALPKTNWPTASSSVDGSPLPAATATNAPAPIAAPSVAATPVPAVKHTITPKPAKTPSPTPVPEVYIEIKGKQFSSTISTLSLSGRELTDADLANIKSLKQLWHISCGENSITDLSLFAGLEHLSSLDLPYNEISDIGPISDITSLTDLTLKHNKISDIAPLSTLTNLARVSLNENTISDITPLSGLTNLRSLNLDDNQITDLSPLAKLSDLVALQLSGNLISDFSPIVNLNNLAMLDLSSNKNVTDFSPISKLDTLELLLLSENDITDIHYLSELRNLEALDLDGNHITDITPLSGLDNLNTLGLNKNQITDFSPLFNLSNLVSLTINDNQITDISQFSNFSNPPTIHLDLVNNQISDISSLSNFSNLNYLYLDNNQITDLTPLAELSDLRTLYLDGNPISQEQLSYIESVLPDCWIHF
jgi:internalin A